MQRQALALSLAATFALGFAGCSDPAKTVEERQRALDEARVAAEKERAATPEARPASAEGPKHPYWDDPSSLVIRHEKACPENLWALFSGPAPGSDDEEKKRNEARRKELAEELRGRTFIARLRGPSEVKLGEYNAAKGRYPVEVKSVLDCEDSLGRVAIALGEAKAVDMPKSAMPGSSSIVQAMWDGPARIFAMPFESQADAKSFGDKHRFGMEAYVSFRVGKTDVHKKLVKVPKASGGGITIGGGTDDFGAGRILRAEVQAVRLAANPGPVVLIDTREPGEARFGALQAQR
jgi:hypothetical protein